jgi:hypothetical protein
MICQVLGEIAIAYMRTVSSSSMPISGATTLTVPLSSATNTNWPDVLQ